MLLVTICREAIDDWRRHKRDQEVNSQKCRRLLNDPGKAVEIVPASKLKVSALIWFCGRKKNDKNVYLMSS